VNWDVYSVFAALSGVACLALGLLGLGSTRLRPIERFWCFLGGGLSIFWAIEEANATSGVFFYSKWIFVLPFVIPIAIVGGRFRSGVSPGSRREQHLVLRIRRQSDRPRRRVRRHSNVRPSVDRWQTVEHCYWARQRPMVRRRQWGDRSAELIYSVLSTDDMSSAWQICRRAPRAARTAMMVQLVQGARS
jgi:hypothetical protein